MFLRTVGVALCGAVLATLAFGVGAFPPENLSKGALQGHIKDSEGAVLAKARIVVHWDPAGMLKTNVGIPEDRSTVTDVNGDYSIDLPPGFYDVFVSAMAFDPASQKVRVLPGRTATYNTQLSVSAVVSQEIAH